MRGALGDVGESLAFVPLDVTDEAQASTAVEAAMAPFGRIDVLVNNAGFSLLGNLEEMTTSELERPAATNFWGVVMCCGRYARDAKAAVGPRHQHQLGRRSGRVQALHAYGATKFAVEGLCFGGLEVEQFGIKVTLVEPGFFLTDLLAAGNARYPDNTIDDYTPEGKPKENVWSVYNGTQQGDPGLSSATS